MNCVECGKPTEWVVQLCTKRPGDPPSPFPCCHACSCGPGGRFRRRNLTTWSPELRAKYGLAPIAGEPAWMR